MKKAETHRLFTSVWVPYLALVIGALLAMVLMLFRTRASTREALTTLHRELLVSSSQQLETLLPQLQELAQQNAYNPYIRRVATLNESFNYRNSYTLYQALENFRMQFGNDKELVTSYYIYFVKHDAVLTPRSAYLQSRDFYRDYIESVDTPEANARFEAWRTALRDESHSKALRTEGAFHLWENQDTSIAYLQTLHMNLYNHSKNAQIVFVLDQREIMKRYSEGQNREYALYDSVGGRLLLESAPGAYERMRAYQRDGKRDATLVRQKSEATGVEYLVYAPSEPVEAALDRISGISLLVLGVSALVLLGSSLLGAWRNFVPLRRVARLIGPPAPQQNYSYSDIIQRMENAMVEDRLRSADFARNLEILRGLLYRTIVFELYANEEELLRFVRSADLSDEASAYLLLCIGCSAQAEASATLEGLQARLSDVLEVLGVRHRGWMGIYGNILGVIVAADALPEGIATLQQAAFAGIPAQERARFALCHSGEGCALADIGKQYRALQQEIYSRLHIEESALRAIAAGQDTYTLDAEIRLFELIREGKAQNVEALLDGQFASLRDINEKLKMCFYIYNTFLRVSKTERRDDLFDRLLSFRAGGGGAELEALYDAVKSAIVEHCQQQRAPEAGTLEQRVQAYIREHYSEAQLSVALLAEAFGLSESYLSTLYKKNTGVRISEFIEDTRLQQATLLLREGKLSVQQIAEQVGYQNDQTFRRAYKRKTGLSPSQAAGAVELTP